MNQFLYRISESSGFTNNGTKWNNKFGVEFKHEKSRNSLIFQGTSAFTKHMRRPERSEDRTRSGGSWSCADRSGVKTAQDPGDLGFAPTGAERRYEPGFVSSAPASKTKRRCFCISFCFTTCARGFESLRNP